MDHKSYYSALAALWGAGLLLLALAGPGCKAPRASFTVVRFEDKSWYESEFKPLTADYRVFDPALRDFASVKMLQARRLAAVHPERPVEPDTWSFFAAAQQGDWRQAHHLYWKLASLWEQGAEGGRDEQMATAVWYPVHETFRAYELVSHAPAEFLRIGLEITNSMPSGSIYFGGSDPGRFLFAFLNSSRTNGEPFFTLTQNALHDGMYLESVREMYGGKLNLPTSNDLHRAWATHLTARDRSDPGASSQKDQTQILGGVGGTDPAVQREINGHLVQTILEMNPTREGFIEGNVRFNWNEPHLVPHGLIFHLHREPLTELSEDIVRRDRNFWGHQVARLLGRDLAQNLSVTNLAHFLEQVWVDRDLSGFKGDPDYIREGRPREDRTDDLNPAVVLAAARLAIADLYLWRAQTAVTENARARMLREADLAYRQALALGPYDFTISQSYLDFLASQQRFGEILRLVEMTPRLFPEKDLQDWQQQWRDLVEREKSRP